MLVWLYRLLIFTRLMYLRVVFCSDISRHKTGTSLITRISLFLRLSPLPHPAIFKIGLLTYLLTYFMVQSPSWEANWFAASQEIPRISRNPKVHYRTHKRPPPVSILGQPNPVHIPTSHLLEIHLLRDWKWFRNYSYSFRFSPLTKWQFAQGFSDWYIYGQTGGKTGRF